MEVLFYATAAVKTQVGLYRGGSLSVPSFFLGFQYCLHPFCPNPIYLGCHHHRIQCWCLWLIRRRCLQSVLPRRPCFQGHSDHHVPSHSQRADVRDL